MGIQEALFGVGALALLAGLIYASIVSGRRRRNGAANAATRRNFDKT